MKTLVLGATGDEPQAEVSATQRESESTKRGEDVTFSGLKSNTE